MHESGMSAGSDEEALVGSVERFLERARQRPAAWLLVVDRDPAWLGPLAEELAALNCRLAVTPLPAAAEDLAARLKPTLVLLAADDAATTLARLERLLAISPRPFVALLLDAGQAASELPAEAQAVGACGVLSRPPSADAVLQAVRMWAGLA